MKNRKCVICGNNLSSQKRICCSKECADERQRQVWIAYYKNNPHVRLRKAEEYMRRRNTKVNPNRNENGFGFNFKNPFDLNEANNPHERIRYFTLKYGKVR